MHTFSKKQKSLITKAFDVAKNSTHKFKIGAIAYNKKPLVQSCNIGDRTHPRLPGKIDKLHAEMRILKLLDNEAKGIDMVVVRGTLEKPMLARPCISCLRAMREAGVRRVAYSTDGGFEVMKL